jgi:4'-phosphopantetheinyl transferase
MPAERSTSAYWLEQTEADVPTQNDWLSADENTHLATLRFAKRRSDWRLGRWTAKRALAVCLNRPDLPRSLAEIEIWPSPAGDPQVFIAEKPAAATISLSHRSEMAACAVVLAPAALGCDLELIEPHSQAFVDDFFTAEEHALVAACSADERLQMVTLLWSAKESALKALHTGLRLDTRSVIALPESPSGGDADWHRLQVRCLDGNLFDGWWQSSGTRLRTVVCSPPILPPFFLDLLSPEQPLRAPSAIANARSA